MPYNAVLERTIADAMRIKELMKCNPDFKMKDVTAESLEGDLASITGCVQQMETLDLQMTPLRHQRDNLAERLAEVCTRARSGFKSYFGPDSAQYQQAGGTRLSERKRPQRRPYAATLPDASASSSSSVAAAAARN